MIYQYVATFLLIVALVLQFAVDRAPDIKESHDNAAARKVLIAGLAIMTAYMVRLCWYEIPFREIPVIALTMISFAEIAFCVNRLFPTVFVNLSDRFHTHQKQ